MIVRDDYLIHEFQCGNHFRALFLREHWSPFTFLHVFICGDGYNQNISHRLCLLQMLYMPIVQAVETTKSEDTLK